MKFRASWLISACVLYACLVAETFGADLTAKGLMQESGFSGGLCVFLEPGSTDLAVSMAEGGAFIVQALYTDKKSLSEVRSKIRAQGVYGKVSAIQWDGKRLPYTDDLVNIIVTGKIGDHGSEIERVLSPRGAAFTMDNRLAFRKPVPDDIDEWSHYCHGPDGNPVANDERVGPPKHYQWVAGPLWLRDHDTDSSIDAMVTGGGRIFYMVDEAPISTPGQHALPDKWFLVGRDAFNGVLLWKIPVEKWGWREWKETWFQARPGDFPLNLQRRFVVEEDKVYVTLGYRAPVSQLDAGTGRVLKVYEGTDKANEIICRDGRLYVSINGESAVRIICLEASSGKVLWQTAEKYKGTTKDYIKFKEMHGGVKESKLDPAVNLAVDGAVVCLLDGRDLVCLGADDGKEKWRTEVADEDGDAWLGSLIVQDKAVVCATANTLYGLSKSSGEKLWTQEKKQLGHLWYEWKDVFVIKGLVWTYSAELKKQGGVFSARWPDSFKGYDVMTGEVKKAIPAGDIFTAHHHHRCYRNKATERYILTSRRGTEFVDLIDGQHSVHNWLRGACHLGMMPANGLQYAPPHPCRCYVNEKLPGFNAIASERRVAYSVDKDSVRFEKGSAYSEETGQKIGASAYDWPTYRHDPSRSGSTFCVLPDKLKLLWSVRGGPRLSAPIIADGKVFAASIDEHHVFALDMVTGSKLWEIAAGGRVDSPPTYYKGMVLFGSEDGWVYAVRAYDGELAWRFRAAPEERQIGSFGQLGSAWPVSGSVMVQNPSTSSGQAVAYFCAGRSSYLDGGIKVFGVDAITGKLLHQTVLEGPETVLDNESQFKYGSGPGSLPDILQGDGKLVHMRDKSFDESLTVQSLSENRLRPLGGFLDDTYFRRADWYYKKSSCFGQLIVHDDDGVYVLRMFPNRKLLDPNNFFTPGNNECKIIVERKNGESRVSVANSNSLNPAKKPMTIEAWINASSPDGAIAARGGSNSGYALVVKKGRPRFLLRINDKVYGVTARQSVVGRWAHVAGVVTEEKKLRIYIDGELSAAAETPSLMTGSPGQAMEIGADEGSGAGEYESPFPFGGIIDELRIYHRALADEEIKEHAANPGKRPGKEDGLVLCYSFDNGNAEDESGKGNDGKVDGAKPVEGRVGGAMQFFDGRSGGWEKAVPIRVRAMVAAGDQLVIAGPPDVMDPKDPLGSFEGRLGGMLRIFSKDTGNSIGEYDLVSPPVFDGMAVAEGCLFIVSMDGKVSCFGKGK